MDIRKKLVELLENNREHYLATYITEHRKSYEEYTADHLIAHGVTVQTWISIESGELQNYIGVPVCIKRKTDGECWWAIIRGIKGNKVSTDYGGYFKLSEYGETWIVKYLPLPQPPKEGDKNGKA